MVDARTTEQIIDEALQGWDGSASPVADIVAALAAAGRLVTPEHDAKVRRDVLWAVRDVPGVREAYMEATLERLEKDAAD